MGGLIFEGSSQAPVAVTPHEMLNCKLLDGGNVTKMPVPCNKAMVTDAAIGQVALNAAVQVTALQLRPTTAGSRSDANVAVYGPTLLTVTV